jgi:hypothetical protein
MGEKPTRRRFLHVLLGAPAALSALEACSSAPAAPGAPVAPETAGPALLDCRKRKSWSNYVGTQTAEPLALCAPGSSGAVASVVTETGVRRLSVKAVGSGHAWSDVALTDGVMVLPDNLRSVLPLERETLKPSAPPLLFRVQSGITIRQLNEALAAAGLGLINMGGYDGQTIAGATSTATHGSGIEFPPLCDIIESVEIIPSDGHLYRIEPSSGITDPAAFAKRHPDIRLLQDDKTFYSVIVGIGCMGVITSVILRVTEKYWLTERRWTSPWPEVRAALAKGDVLRQHRHYEVLLNPHPLDGVNLCLITTRDPAVPPIHESPFLERNVLVALGSLLPPGVLEPEPKKAPQQLNLALKLLVREPYTRVSYEVLNIGAPNNIPAISAELAFPMAGSRYLDAIDRFLQLAEIQRAVGDRCHSSPVSLRFVKASKAFLAPQSGRDTCMLEIIFGKGTKGANEMLYFYETELYKYGARPHWGQLNYVTGGHPVLRKMYPQYDNWLEVYKKFNTNHLFDSAFAKRVGIADYEQSF